MSLGRFCPTVKKLAQVSIVTSLSVSPYNKLHALVVIITSAKYCMLCNHNNPTMQTISNSCIQLTTLNRNHFKMVKAMELKLMT
jgi:hypothetical protein